MKPAWHVIGYASGIGGADIHCGQGPKTIRESAYLNNHALQWGEMIVASQSSELPLTTVKQLCEKLAATTLQLTKQHTKFCVLGGDHTCAIGTWSGVFSALQSKGELGLIWIDAHMDSHTPASSQSGRLHGMPLATLLGFGDDSLIHILSKYPKVKPENLCLIGARSYEDGEAALLRKLNVRTYFMEEIAERSLNTVFAEAKEWVTQRTAGFGISLDLDSIDPKEAPGVDVPEPNGLHAKEVMEGLQSMLQDPKLVGIEIVEFDPIKDKHQLTEKLVTSFLTLLSE